MSHYLQTTKEGRTAFPTAEGEKVLRTIEAQWRAARGTRSVPQQAHLDTRELAEVLTHSFTLERVTSSVARFRVAGQAIHSHLNMEPRGMPISAIFTPQGRQMLAPLIYDTCECPAIVEVPLIAQRRFVRTSLRGRLLMLPLRNGSGPTNSIFGALVLDGKNSGRPLRFDFDADGALRIEHITPVVRTIHEVATMTPEHPDTIRPAQTVHQNPTVFPRLRLVVDNT